MKIHEFRDVCICASWSICTVFLMICITVYGISLMEGWFNVDDRFGKMTSEIKVKMEENNKAERFVNQRWTKSYLENSLMASSFKGQSNGGSRR